MAIHDAGMFTVKEINRLVMNVTCVLARLPRCSASRSRLLKRYRQSRPLGMNNQSRGRTGNCLLPASLTDLALSIIRERNRDFGPTLAGKNWRKFTVWSWARKPSDAL